MTAVVSHRSLKEKQRQEREELILQVAEEVLMEKGYHDTSMDEIALRVGIAKGTVYLHFPGKEDLVVAIFQRDMEKFLQIVEATADTGKTAQEKLEAILQCIYGGMFTKRIQLLSSIYNSSELRRIFMEKKGCMRDLWEKLSTNVAAFLEEGKIAGEFDSTLPTPVMLAAFFSLLSPRSYEPLMVEGQLPSAELVNHLWHIYFKGIAAV